MKKALFVATANALGREGGTSGGVQLCTREYLRVLERAGFEISPMAYTTDRRFLARVTRRLFPRPFADLVPPSLLDEIVHEASKIEAHCVFLNMIDLAILAEGLKKALGPGVKIILCSHGLHSADILHNMRIRAAERGALPTRRDQLWLAGNLVQENIQRQYLDHIFTLAEFETGLERWLGAQSVSWLPRIVEPRPLDWQPHGDRFGFVGTLDHPANAEGLSLFLEALSRVKNSARVRVVGGPAKAGRELAARYSFVDYLGQLGDESVAEEARTWTCAVHPLFCYPRGCSTKLATYLSWQIPVVTTESGCRGYRWENGTIPQARTPDELARLALTLNDPAEAKRVRDEIIKVSASSPGLKDVAAMAAEHLSRLGLRD